MHCRNTMGLRDKNSSIFFIPQWFKMFAIFETPVNQFILWEYILLHIIYNI